MFLQKIIPIYFILLLSSLYAIEIDISLSDSTDANAVDIERFKVMLQKRNMGISDANAKSAIQENRILANAYMKEYGIPDLLKIEMQIILEEKLRNMLVRKEKEKIEINNDVLLSYYKDHKDEFYKSEEITFNVYNFENYEEAYSFYSKNRDNYTEINNYVKDNNITKASETMLKSKLHKELRALLQEGNATKYITPPEFFNKKYMILDVVSIQKAKISPFNTVKKKVRASLLSKINQDTKTKLLAKYKKNGKE